MPDYTDYIKWTLIATCDWWWDTKIALHFLISGTCSIAVLVRILVKYHAHSCRGTPEIGLNQ